MQTPQTPGAALFAVYTPFEIDLEKAEQARTDGRGYIRGVMSAEGRDFQGEELVQDGIDWSYFEKHGWFNWEHQPGPENILGYPERVIRGLVTPAGKPATGVEGYLLLNDPRAKKIYDLAEALQKSGTDRRPGFSIEGYAVDRDPHNKRRVTRAKVLNVTVTAHPIQPDGRFEVLMRSLMAADVAGVGYQAAGQTAGGDAGNLAPLVRQDLGEVMGSATYGQATQDTRDALVERAMRRLSMRFPRAPREELYRIACKIVDGAACADA